MILISCFGFPEYALVESSEATIATGQFPLSVLCCPQGTTEMFLICKPTPRFLVAIQVQRQV